MTLSSANIAHAQPTLCHSEHTTRPNTLIQITDNTQPYSSVPWIIFLPFTSPNVTIHTLTITTQPIPTCFPSLHTPSINVRAECKLSITRLSYSQSIGIGDWMIHANRCMLVCMPKAHQKPLSL